MKTIFTKTADLKDTKWYLFDAKGQVLGRLAAEAAKILTGKISASYTPNADSGNGVIVINATGIRVTGNKAKGKIYTTYSGYPGGLKERPYEWVFEKDPTYVIKHAIKGMLPKSVLGKRMMTRVLVYLTADHPHKAQKPIVVGKDKTK